jgi:hypothetical protein
MPVLAPVAIMAGIYSFQWEGLLDLQSPWIIAAIVILLNSSIQGFGVIMPAEVRIFLKSMKGDSNRDLVVRLGFRNVKIPDGQAIFQTAIIFITARLTMMPSTNLMAPLHLNKPAQDIVQLCASPLNEVLRLTQP